MWILPPIRGQKVILDPSGNNYASYNRRQARDSAGHIVDVGSHHVNSWHGYSTEDVREVNVTVKWENGNTNGYRLRDLLPIDVFKEEVVTHFKDGDMSYATGEELDKRIDQKLIVEGVGIHSQKKYDEEYRKGIYIKVRNNINRVIESGNINTHQSNIMMELSRMGYSFGNPEDRNEQEHVEGLRATSFATLEGLNPSAEILQSPMPGETMRMPSVAETARAHAITHEDLQRAYDAIRNAPTRDPLAPISPQEWHDRVVERQRREQLMHEERTTRPANPFDFDELFDNND